MNINRNLTGTQRHATQRQEFFNFQLLGSDWLGQNFSKLNIFANQKMIKLLKKMISTLINFLIAAASKLLPLYDGLSSNIYNIVWNIIITVRGDIFLHWAVCPSPFSLILIPYVYLSNIFDEGLLLVFFLVALVYVLMYRMWMFPLASYLSPYDIIHQKLKKRKINKTSFLKDLH